MSGVILKFTLPCAMICIVSSIGIPCFTGVVVFCCRYSVLTFNCSNVVFTSWIFSKIEARWFSMFSHMSENWSSTFVAIKSMLSCINDVSIGFLWDFFVFLEPLGCSPVLFLVASGGSYAYGIWVSMPVSCPTSSSMATLCSFICTSSALSCLVDPLDAFSGVDGPSVGSRCELFCVIFFF
jgi:hypothetical protein